VAEKAADQVGLDDGLVRLDAVLQLAEFLRHGVDGIVDDLVLVAGRSVSGSERTQHPLQPLRDRLQGL